MAPCLKTAPPNITFSKFGKQCAATIKKDDARVKKKETATIS
jgi:hypothetical protein